MYLQFWICFIDEQWLQLRRGQQLPHKQRRMWHRFSVYLSRSLNELVQLQQWLYLVQWFKLCRIQFMHLQQRRLWQQLYVHNDGTRHKQLPVQSGLFGNHSGNELPTNQQLCFKQWRLCECIVHLSWTSAFKMHLQFRLQFFVPTANGVRGNEFVSSQ